MIRLAKKLRPHIKITTHGFRSTFRDWCGDETEFAREVAEAALAHAVGNAVEQTYRRGTALAKRRTLMEAWVRIALAASWSPSRSGPDAPRLDGLVSHPGHPAGVVDKLRDLE